MALFEPNGYKSEVCSLRHPLHYVEDNSGAQLRMCYDCPTLEVGVPHADGMRWETIEAPDHPIVRVPDYDLVSNGYV